MAQKSNDEKVDETKEYAEQRLAGLKKNLDEARRRTSYDHLKNERTIGPGGRNIFEEQYINLGNTLAHKQMRIGELSQQLMIAQSFPRPDFGRPSRGAGAADRACSSTQKKKLGLMLQQARRTIRNFDSDPGRQGARAAMLERDPRRARRARSGSRPRCRPNPTEMILDRYQTEIEDDKAQHQAVLAQMQDSMPDAPEVPVAGRGAERRPGSAIVEMDRNIAGLRDPLEVAEGPGEDPLERGRADRADPAQPGDVHRPGRDRRAWAWGSAWSA